MVGQGGVVRRDHETSESTAVTINEREPSQDLIAALTEDNGLLANGAVPTLPNLSAEGQKALVDSLAKAEGATGAAPKAKGKAKAKAKAVCETAMPRTTLELAETRMPEVLKMATEARRHALALKGVNYSGELVEGMMNFSNRMEQTYEKLQDLVASGENGGALTKLLDKTTEEETWYVKAEARVKDLLQSHWGGCFKTHF